MIWQGMYVNGRWKLVRLPKKDAEIASFFKTIHEYFLGKPCNFRQIIVE